MTAREKSLAKRADKSFGQHFLADGAVLQAIARLVAEKADGLPLIEIGAGMGTLTAAVAAKTTGPLTAIELDRRLIPDLERATAAFGRVKVVRGNALETDAGAIVPEAKDGGYGVFGNIPYNITSLLLRKVLAWRPRPRFVAFMVDKEVAARITAKPGEMSLLALSVQNLAEAEIAIPDIPPSAFLPPPKVRSVVVLLSLREKPLVPKETEKDMFVCAKAAFAQKRKMLSGSLGALWHADKKTAADALAGIGIDARLRPQDLGIDRWTAIAGLFQNKFRRGKL